MNLLFQRYENKFSGKIAGFIRTRPYGSLQLHYGFIVERLITDRAIAAPNLKVSRPSPQNPIKCKILLKIRNFIEKMSFSYKQIDYDVIIVGAGLSGMVTAWSLLEREPTLPIAILELTNKVGGRLCSVPLRTRAGSSQFFDVGCHWIQSNRPCIAKLLANLKINLCTIPDRNHILIGYKGYIRKIKTRRLNRITNPLNQVQFVSFIVLIEHLCKQATLPPDFEKYTMGELLEKNVKSKYVKALFKYIILSQIGVPADQVTVAFYVFFCISHQGVFHQLLKFQLEFRRSFIKGGAQEICDKLLARFEDRDILMLNQEVTEIRTSKKEVEVVTKSARFCCNFVIMAMPLMDAHNIHFDPPLETAKRTVISNAVEGVLSTFIITYKTRFWAKSGYTSGSGDLLNLNEPTAEKPVINCFEISPEENCPALSGHFYNPRKTKNNKKAILSQVSDYLGPEALNYLDFNEKIWASSPTAVLKSAEELDALIENSESRIYWTGAETSPEFYGSLAAAVEAAQRVAVEVLYMLRPASLNHEDMALILKRKKRKKVLHSYTDIYKKFLNYDHSFYCYATLLICIYVMWHHKYHLRLIKFMAEKLNL